jgi:hypothetical protein
VSQIYVEHKNACWSGALKLKREVPCNWEALMGEQKSGSMLLSIGFSLHATVLPVAMYERKSQEYHRGLFSMPNRTSGRLTMIDGNRREAKHRNSMMFVHRLLFVFVLLVFMVGVVGLVHKKKQMSCQPTPKSKKIVHNSLQSYRRMLCILRESNPGQLLGRQLSYRWTKNA